MTFEELQRLLTEAAWFSNFGGPAATIRTIDELFDLSTGTWDWLPTTPDQADPIHGDALLKLASDLGAVEQRRSSELAAARIALASMRVLPETVPGLSLGPHDLTIAAKGAAVYAARMAAREIAVERSGLWCEAIRYYHRGYWPCGLDNERRMVVY